MTNQEKLEYCLGCEEDFYNDKNPYAIKECWHLKSATLILRKRFHIDEKPPWKRKPEKLFKCFRQKRYVFVERKVNC